MGPKAPVAIGARTRELPTAAPLPVPLPSIVRFDPTKLAGAARRELGAHLASHGLPLGPNAVRDLAEAELAAARAIDPRVSPAEMSRAVARAAQAERASPLPQRGLYGFTALSDAKVQLTTELIHAMAKACLRPPRVTEADLRIALKAGPGKGEIAWSKPKNDLELVASLVRQMVLHGGSFAMSLDADRVKFIERVLAKADTRMAMGGAGGFCANLASVLPNVEARFFAKEPLSAELGARFGARVGLVGTDAEPRKLKGEGGGASRVNYALEYPPGLPIDLPLSGGLRIGDITRLKSRGASRVLLGTPSSFEPGFGEMRTDALKTLGKSHELCFLVGAHYFTKGTPEAAAAKALALREQLAVMKKANPKLVRHLQYVVPKQPLNEAKVLLGLSGGFDSIALNSVEVPDLLERLSKAAGRALDIPNDKEHAEDPKNMLAGALALAEALKVGRVHLHGALGDLLVLDSVADPERQVLALLRARQLASMKCANETGEVKAPTDLWPIAPVVMGKGLAAVRAFADAVGDQSVVDRWWWKDPASGRTVFFVPSRGIHERTGSTVSTGDTIDATALIYGLEQTSVAKKLVGPGAF